MNPDRLVETTVRRVGPETAGMRQARADLIADNHVRPGFYRLQLVARAPWSVARIWHGFSIEPGTHHFREVTLGWHALLNGAAVAIERVWPRCAWEPITRGEYRYRLSLHRWCLKYARHRPEASPDQPVDFVRLHVGGDR